MTSGPKIQMRGLWSKLERALSPGVAAGQALAYLTCLTKVSLETFRLSTLVLQMHGRVGQDWHILLKSDKAVKWASFAVGIKSRIRKWTESSLRLVKWLFHPNVQWTLYTMQ